MPLSVRSVLWQQRLSREGKAINECDLADSNMMSIDNIFAKHKRASLFFSAGKDSLACLSICKKYWDQLDVVWVNTGKNLPEVLDCVAQVRAMVPHFIEITSCQDNFIREAGHPVDVVATHCDADGCMFSSRPRKRKQVSKYHCCAHNIWRPLQAYMEVMASTAIIKGQRADDHEAAPWVDKCVIGNREIDVYYPIKCWTAGDVRRHLEAEGYDAPRLALEHSSLDCWDCTAYWDVLGERSEYMSKHHPEKWAVVSTWLKEIKDDITTSVAQLSVKEK